MGLKPLPAGRQARLSAWEANTLLPPGVESYANILTKQQ